MGSPPMAPSRGTFRRLPGVASGRETFLQSGEPEVDAPDGVGGCCDAPEETGGCCDEVGGCCNQVDGRVEVPAEPEK